VQCRRWIRISGSLSRVGGFFYACRSYAANLLSSAMHVLFFQQQWHWSLRNEWLKRYVLLSVSLLCPAPRVGALSDDARLTSDVCLSVAYIGPKSRTERPRKTKIGTEVRYVTRDSDTTFKVKRSKVNLQGRGHIVAASGTACYHYNLLICHSHQSSSLWTG